MAVRLKSHSHNLRRLVRVAAFLCLSTTALHAWTPGTGSPEAVSGFTVDTTSRADVLSFYNCIYTASANDKAKIGWNGSVANCLPGTTSAAFKDDILRRINFYRALVAVPAGVSFDPVKNAKAQQAALMMSRNATLSHDPPATWQCYTADGAEAAGKSNLFLGGYGASSVDGYIVDPGLGNEIVGHRRWLLYSRAVSMGTGDIPGESGYSSANAIWVIGNAGTAPPAAFIPWPNRGYSPFPLMPARWSLSYPGASFASATVSMTVGGVSVATNVISRADNGYGDNTIVWAPSGLPASITTDVVCSVTVSGISNAGGVTSYTYPVNLFDPDRLGESVTIAGSDTPPKTGGAYTFSPISRADAYELRVSSATPGTWVEGAEDSPAPQIEQFTTGSYALRQSDLKRSGSKAFQLVTPDFNNQSFVITRDIIASATSELKWFDRGRFATTTTTLDAEISTDSGATWTSVFRRSGVGLSSSLWDANWLSRSVSLSAYAGQIVKVRFIMRIDGSITSGITPNYGFFIDDVSVTNASEVSDATVTTLTGSTSSFTLNSATAGAPLVAGSAYYMRVRPNVGNRWFGDGALKVVTVQDVTGYAAWVANQYPLVIGGATDDYDVDGIPNGVEYAFGLNPMIFTHSSELPQPVISGNAFRVSFSQPAEKSDVTYVVCWSDDLSIWHKISDTGSGGDHVFSVSTTGHNRLFLRHEIVVSP
ncbi:MAG: CAP domain-containing protein [Luteolibacter sp.]